MPPSSALAVSLLQVSQGASKNLGPGWDYYFLPPLLVVAVYLVV